MENNINKRYKSFTSLEQSKKLAEILPLENADMRYGYIAPYDYSDRMFDGGYDEVPYPKDFLKRNPNFSENEYDGEFPCWSLAALLGVLPFHLIVDNQRYAFNMHKGLNKEGETYIFGYNVFNTDICLYSTNYHNNPVDACYEMIIKLKEQNLL